MSRVRARLQTLTLDECLPALFATGWFLVTLIAILWVWGLNPEALATPDEAVNRLAAELLRHHRRPFMKLPFADPEDLAHPRHWVSLGDHAVPAYSPLAFYLQGALLRLGRFGLLLSAALPASAAAAFCAGTAQLLPSDRRWLALPAPLLGFPALYWLMRPWMNISTLLICLCWAFYFWARWLNRKDAEELGLALVGVGMAAALRPDFAAYLLLVTLLLGVAASPKQWRRIVTLVLVAGASAVAVNLVLNWRVTGQPLRAAYQIVAARDEGGERAGGVLGVLGQLLLPMGAPKLAVALAFLGRYWLLMGPVLVLTLLQLTLVPNLLAKPRLSRLLYGLALLVMLAFMFSHMDPELAGAAEDLVEVHHSMPRYWAPIYLLAALPPLLFLGACRNRVVLNVGAGLVFALAVVSGYELVSRESLSLVELEDFTKRSQQSISSMKREVPEDAIVYSASYDKLLWSRWSVGTIDAPEPSARSVERAFATGRPVYVFDPSLKSARLRAFERALSRKQLDLVRRRTRGLYRVASAGSTR